MSEFKLENLPKEEQDALMEQAKLRLAQEEEDKKRKREEYKDFVSEEVEQLFEKIFNVCEIMKRTKQEVSDSMETLIKTKKEVFKSSADNKTHTASNRAGNKRITKGYRDISDWDGTEGEGVAKIQAFIGSLAKDEDSANLVEGLQILLKPDKKGQLDPRRLLELKNWSEKIKNPDFTDGVNILINAYRIVKSKTFVLVEYRNDGDKWTNVELTFSDIA